MSRPTALPSNLPLSESTLEQLRAGDPKAVEAFLARIRPRLRNMLDRTLNPSVRSRLDASDIVQETLLRVASGLKNYLGDPKIPLDIWVRVLGKQVAAEMHRAQFRGKRDPAREIDWDSVCGELVVNRMADSMHEVWKKVSVEETRDQVRDAIAKLPTIDREVLEMRHVQEFTLRDVADELMISTEAAKKRYQRALKRFRQFAEEIDKEEIEKLKKSKKR